MEINRYLDHAILKPEMTFNEVKNQIQAGIAYKVYSVCVRPCDIALAVSMCESTETSVSCVLDFPHGNGGAKAKEALAVLYAEQGVKEIDMVMNYGYARSDRWDAVEDEIRRVVIQAHKRNVIVKVIFETCKLTLEQIKKGVEVCITAGADFVKTSTGFSSGGASVEAVQTMLETANSRIQVKASGGIRDFDTAKMYADMGCTRLGVGFSSTPAICGASNSNHVLDNY